MNSYSLKYGLIAGLILAFLNMILFFVDPELLYDDMINLLVGLVTYVFFMYKAIADTRKEDGGYLEFGDALLAGLITFAIASLLSIFSLFIISSTSQVARDAEYQYTLDSLDKAPDFFSMFMDEDQISIMRDELEKSKEELEYQFEDGKSPGSNIGLMFLGWLGMLFGGTILALIMAAILKKSAPLS